MFRKRTIKLTFPSEKDNDEDEDYHSTKVVTSEGKITVKNTILSLTKSVPQNFAVLLNSKESIHSQISKYTHSNATKSFSTEDKTFYKEFCNEYGKDIFLSAGTLKTKEEFINLVGWCRDKGKYNIDSKNMSEQEKIRVANKVVFMATCIKPNVLEIVASFINSNRRFSCQEQAVAENKKAALSFELEVVAIEEKNPKCSLCKLKKFTMINCNKCGKTPYCCSLCMNLHSQHKNICVRDD